MSKLLFVFIISISLLIACSSDPIIEKQYYEGTDIVEIERKYYSEDEGNYEFSAYYPNGQIMIKGQYVDSLYEGDWEYWYEDGRKQVTIPYVNGRICYEKKDRKMPSIIISDSMKIGIAYELKMIDLYFGERTMVSPNAIRTVKDGVTYIIPQSGDSVSIYYNMMEKVDIDLCKEEVTEVVGLVGKEVENVVVYKTQQITLKTIPIYK